MHTFAQKPKARQQTTPATSILPNRAPFGQAQAATSILQLQRTIGNQAVQRMVQTRAVAPSVGVIIQREKQVHASCDEREPADGAVNGIITSALGGSRSATYPVSQLQDAWFRVRNQREQPDGANCCSPELAAAEHYLYARYAVANRDYSRLEMKAHVFMYGYFKFLVPKTGICPKSANTEGSRDWGYRGADDGANDLFHQDLAQNDEEQTEEPAEATA